MGAENRGLNLGFVEVRGKIKSEEGIVVDLNKIKRASSRKHAEALKTGKLREMPSAMGCTNSAMGCTKPPGVPNGVTIGGRPVYVTYHPENKGKPGYQTEFWRIG